MRELPFFIFAFADPVGDLDFVKQEVEELNVLLKYPVLKEELHFLDVKNATGQTVIAAFDEWKKKKPCLFHFSGHASHIGLKLQDGHSQTALELAAILAGSNIKILFLNACSTSTLVKDILSFKNSPIEAVIATRCPVRDDLAFRLSKSFYEFFVARKMPLEEAYNKMWSLYSASCIEKTPAGKKRIDEMDDELAAFDNASSFSWGLFPKNSEILSVTINSMLDNTRILLAEIDKEIANIKTKLESAEGILELVSGNNSAYKYQLAVVEEIKAALKQQEGKRRKLIENKTDQVDNIIEETNQRELTVAIKNLNYSKQRDKFKMKNEPMGGFIMPGDPDSVLDLLCLNFMEENGLHEVNTSVLRFYEESPIYNEFWNKMAMDLQWDDLPENFSTDDKRKIVRHIVHDKFGAGGDEPHQNILFKLLCTNRELDALERTLDEFWQLLDDHIVEEQLTEKMKSWKRKIVFLLIDEAAEDTRKKEFEELVNRLKAKGRFKNCFHVLDKVDYMSADAIKAWINEQKQLSRMGLDPAMAEDIFKETNGSIRKILHSIKGRVNLKKIPFLDQFKIS